MRSLGKRLFSPSQQPSTRRAVLARLTSQTAGFQREQACFEAGVGAADAQYHLSLSGELDCFVGPAKVAGKVAHTTQHVRIELLVTASADEY